jgi:hypothetical protein
VRGEGGGYDVCCLGEGGGWGYDMLQQRGLAKVTFDMRQTTGWRRELIRGEEEEAAGLKME